MTHPPLPPGCESWIRVYASELRVPLPWGEHAGLWAIVSHHRWLWPWLAARCRCAWIDIADAAKPTYGTPPDEQAEAYDAALENAKAWKAWGEEKEKQRG